MSSTLPPGSHLGRYEIRSQLGAGGMGEVYLAQDTELDRKVAIKILPADLAANQRYFGFDCRIATRVQDLASSDVFNETHAGFFDLRIMLE